MSRRLVGDTWSRSPERRAFDIVTATAVLAAEIPLGGIGAMAFFIENGCDPLFRQERIGKAGSRFKTWKLRTMPFNPLTYNGDHEDASGGDNDDRRTRVGKILSRAKIDDALMVVNVLAGDMSMVGPRPLTTVDTEATYDVLSPSERKDWDWSREILPGQVSDFHAKSRGMDPKSDAFLYARAQSDIWFREHTSPAVDTAIIADAIKGVVVRS